MNPFASKVTFAPVPAFESAPEFPFEPAYEIECGNMRGIAPDHRVSHLCSTNGSCFDGQPMFVRRCGYYCKGSLTGLIFRDTVRDGSTNPNDLLASKLDFPWMLVDERGLVPMPLSAAVERAQRGIDEGLKCLTALERDRYLKAMSWAVFALYPSATLHLITLENGRLRLWDNASFDELCAKCEEIERFNCGMGPAHGLSLDPATVRTKDELLASLSVARDDWADPDELSQQIWDGLVPHIRSGAIHAADVVATGFQSIWYFNRDRLGECRAFKTLVEQEGWDPRFASEAVEFMADLYQMVDATPEVLGDSLAGSGAALEEMLLGNPRLWDEVIREGEEVAGTGFSNFHPGHRVEQQERVARIVDALEQGDGAGAGALLESMFPGGPCMHVGFRAAA